MEIDNIDIERLKNDINVCKNKISRENSKSLTSSILNQDLWVNDSKYHLRNSLATFTDLYDALEKELDKCQEICDAIINYKSAYNDKSAAEARIEEIKRTECVDENGWGAYGDGTAFHKPEAENAISQEKNKRDTAIENMNNYKRIINEKMGV